ncbi:MAG: Rrf2 family transcriptional regulator [Chlorobiaceae bacterium]|nr:Rrf2 family transcriptional regulator [Chlorobiaceae bacterium]NTV25855.1 Rrf2 family transcriptional regulator [Chlorobiaceae bacterium]
MKVLNKHTDYAVRALIALGMKPGSRISAKTLSEEQGIPYQFLRRILQELIRNGLVSSKEGAGGGVALARDPDEIRVRDVIEIFQGSVQVSECMFRKQLCSNRANCVLRHEIMRIERMVNDEFAKVTVGKLIADLKRVEEARAGVQVQE